MNKYGSDNKVKKTLVRNFELKKFSRHTVPATYDMGGSSHLSSAKSSSQQPNELGQPSLCSSEALAHYLSDVKKTLQTPRLAEELNLDKCQLAAKVTRNLNFHFNDRIYKNLIELNASFDEIKTKKGKKPPSASINRDLEPNIEDFCHDEKEHDMVPTVPIIKPKLKPVKKVESGRLHKLVASFEDL